MLEGVKSHDFGVVEVTSPKTTVEHTFILTNTSGEELVLVDVIPDCGCATTEVYQDVIPDGEALILPIQFKLRQSQIRRSTIRLVFANGAVEFLTLQAEGRMKQPLRISPSPIVVKNTGEVGLAILGIERFDESIPPIPEFTTPDGVDVKWTKWRLRNKFNPREKVPANWSMQLELTRDGELPENSDMTIRVDGETVHVTLVDNVTSLEDVPFSRIPVR